MTNEELRAQVEVWAEGFRLAQWSKNLLDRDMASEHVTEEEWQALNDAMQRWLKMLGEYEEASA